MASEADLKILINRRERLYLRLQNLLDASKSALTDPSKVLSFKVRFAKIDDSYNEFEDIQAKIMALQVKLNVDISGASADDIYFEIQSNAEKILKNENLESTTSKCPNPKLPKISLVPFDGNIKSWPTFYGTYKSLIHENRSLNNVDKFHYLHSVVSGPAATIVRSLPLNEANYTVVFEALVKKYENKRLQLACYLDQMLSFKPLQIDGFEQLSKFHETFSENFNAIKAVSVNNLDDFVLLHIALRCLDSNTRKNFETENDGPTLPTFNTLMEFIDKQVRAASLTQASSPCVSKNVNLNKSIHAKSSWSPNFVPKKAILTALAKLCPYCKKNEHTIYKCSDFRSLSALDRLNFSKSAKLCCNCLKGGHPSSACPSKASCFLCGHRHHTLLHTEQNKPKPAPDSVEPSTSSANSHSIAPICHSISTKSTTTLLGTACVLILDSNGQYHKARALIDSGSQISLVTRSFSRRLHFPVQRCHCPITGIGGSVNSSSTGLISLTIKPYNTSQPILHTDAVVLPKITTYTPSVQGSNLLHEEFDQLILADPDFEKPGRIEVLLGADVFPYIFDGGRFASSQGTPIALNSIFGYVIMGKVPNDYSLPSSSYCGVATEPYSLETIMKQFWEVEEVLSEPPVDPCDLICEKMYQCLHQRDDTGRYVVPLMFKDDASLLGESLSIASSSLNSLERRFKRDPDLFQSYNTFLSEYESLGHMKSISSGTFSPSTNYIPHHAVFKTAGNKTKIRVVFNASSKTLSNQSLNDLLYAGPKLQPNLASILCSFRIHPIVFVCDITKMYRQILVLPEHRKFQHILWRPSPNETVKEFELLTVTYGVSSSPYLAIRTLQQLVKDEGLHFPEASKLIANCTYIDDILAGSSSVEDALKLQADLIRLLELGGFELAKWASNDTSLLDHLPPDKCDMQPFFSPEVEISLKLLGVYWDPNSDSFSYHTAPFECNHTKRSVLSCIARLYDPLGWISPVIFLAKSLMQELWKRCLEWDSVLPLDIQKVWISFITSLPLLRHVKIPRYIFASDGIDYHLVGFSDASERGYAAVVYLCVFSKNAEPKIRLLIAKSKVAPIKPLSIPRLELCGALLLAKTFKFLLSSLGECFPVKPKISAWTDSTIVLSWLCTAPHLLKTFVSNRVVQIHDILEPNLWHHVSSDENPADLACRGLLPSNISSCDLWWTGPPWLKLPCTEWPISENVPVASDNIPERKPVHSLISTVTVRTEESEVLQRFSDLHSLQRITAWCLRFSNNCRKPLSRQSSAILSCVELQNALMCWVKHTQEVYFDATAATKFSKSLSSLSPFRDTLGIWRVGGRLQNSSLPYSAKHPILLPKHSHLSHLIIDYYHRSYLHVGPRTLQSLLCRTFWIIAARSVIRQRLRRCLTCLRQKAPALHPTMGNLPSSRVSQGRPFLNVGVDFGGPFPIKESTRRNAKISKAYLALFVCMATKAVHLELVSDLSTDAFLASLNRFVSRRGLCRCIYSDNGRNFLGATRYLMDVQNYILSAPHFETITNALSSQGIEWKFIPPSSPHFGGIWESGIKSAKYHVKRVVGAQAFTFEEFATLFCRIEAVLNSRPLCPISSDANEFDVLTPGHFIIGGPLLEVPEYDLTNTKLNRLSRWQLIQQSMQCFWNRWRKDYLHTLQQKSKWTKSVNNIVEGDLVLIHENNVPPLHWPLGRVERVYPGSDKVVRVVDVKTKAGVFRRPVVKLSPLPKD